VLQRVLMAFYRRFGGTLILYLHGSSAWDLNVNRNGVTSPRCYACAVCESKVDGSVRGLYPLGVLSSGFLRGVSSCETSVSGVPLGPIFKGRPAQDGTCR
jgi:hypothetical protein